MLDPNRTPVLYTLRGHVIFGVPSYYPGQDHGWPPPVDGCICNDAFLDGFRCRAHPVAESRP